MANIRTSVLIASTAVGLSACGSLNSIHETFRTEDSTPFAVSVDAKQRFLIKSKKGVCAEPSPDVFSVYAAALEANASYADKITAGLKLTTGENGGTIGLRTEAIQLLRDAMFRICEASLNGAIEPNDYQALLRKYQKSMITLIAVEQLTGTMRPSQVILSAGSAIELSSDALTVKKNLDESQLKVDDQTQKAAAAKEDVDKSKTALDNAKEGLGDKPDDRCKSPADTDTDACEAANTAYTNAQTLETQAADALKKATTDRDQWLTVFEKTQEAGTLKTIESNSTVPLSGPALTAESITNLSSGVKELVQGTFLQDTVDECFARMGTMAENIGNLAMKVEEPGNNPSQVLKDNLYNQKRILENYTTNCSNIILAYARACPQLGDSQEES